MACGPSNFQNGRRSDQLENGHRTGSEHVFWNILISDSTLQAETSFFHTNFSRRIFWCAWEPVKTPHLKKFVNSENAEGPKKSTLQKWSKNSEFGLKWLQKIQFGAWRPGSGTKLWSGCIGDGLRPWKPSFWPQNIEKYRTTCKEIGLHADFKLPLF